MGEAELTPPLGAGAGLGSLPSGGDPQPLPATKPLRLSCSSLVLGAAQSLGAGTWGPFGALCSPQGQRGLRAFPAPCPTGVFFPLAAGPCAAMTFFLLQNKGREPCVECAGSQQHAERGAHGVGSAAHAGCAVWGRARGVLPPSPPCSLCFCFAAPREGPDAFPQAAERADRPGFPEATAGKGCAGARRCPGDWSCCRSRAGWSGMVGDSLSWLRLGKAGEAASASAGCARPGGDSS